MISRGTFLVRVAQGFIALCLGRKVLVDRPLALGAPNGVGPVPQDDGHYTVDLVVTSSWYDPTVCLRIGDQKIFPFSYVESRDLCTTRYKFRVPKGDYRYISIESGQG